MAGDEPGIHRCARRAIHCAPAGIGQDSIDLNHTGRVLRAISGVRQLHAFGLWGKRDFSGTELVYKCFRYQQCKRGKDCGAGKVPGHGSGSGKQLLHGRHAEQPEQ